MRIDGRRASGTLVQVVAGKHVGWTGIAQASVPEMTPFNVRGGQTEGRVGQNGYRKEHVLPVVLPVNVTSRNRVSGRNEKIGKQVKNPLV